MRAIASESGEMLSVASPQEDAPRMNAVEKTTEIITETARNIKITQTIAEFRKKLHKAGKIQIQDVEHTVLETTAVETLLRTIQSTYEQPQPNATNNLLNQILTNTQEIRKQLAASVQPNQNTTATKSWSQVAAASYNGLLPNAISSGQTRSRETKKAKETVITIENEEEREKTRHIDTETLINIAIGKNLQGPAKEILAARKLLSSDI